MTDKNVKNSTEHDVRTHAGRDHQNADKSHLPKDALEKKGGTRERETTKTGMSNEQGKK